MRRDLNAAVDKSLARLTEIRYKVCLSEYLNHELRCLIVIGKKGVKPACWAKRAAAYPGRSSRVPRKGITKRAKAWRKREEGCRGIEHDIHGFVPFLPQSFINKTELIGYVYPHQIRQWFKENTEKAAKLSPELKKFGTISQNDNPVLMLVKLKE